MKKALARCGGITFAVGGAAAVLLVVLIGSWIGGIIETWIRSPVVSWEMAPGVVWFLATPGGMLVAIVGAISARWWRGLAIGLLIHGSYFGCLGLFASSPATPFAVRGWV